MYSTCCRACALSQGDGEHDANCAGGSWSASSAGALGSSPLDGEAAALIAVERALEDAMKVAEGVDVNGDGKVDFGEFLRYYELLRESGASLSEMASMFHFFDVDLLRSADPPRKATCRACCVYCTPAGDRSRRRGRSG